MYRFIYLTAGSLDEAKSIGRTLLEETDVHYALRKAHPEDLLWDRSGIDMPHRLGVTLRGPRLTEQLAPSHELQQPLAGR